MMKITNLLDHYYGALPEFRTREAVNADRIADITMKKIHRYPETAKKRTVRGNILRTAFIAAAVAAILIVSALAASGFSFSEIPEGIRDWLGIKDEAVPGYVTYDTVNIAANARTSDTDHDGDGEIYVSEVTPDAVRSENLLTIYVSVSSVTREQYENYVWRAQLDGEDGWAIAEPDTERSGVTAYYEDDLPGGRLFLRMAFILDPDKTDTLHVTLYGGTESEDGKTFNAQRIGIFTVDPGTVSDTAAVSFGGGIPFTNSVTGETGTITGADISADRMIWYYRADGLYDLYSVTYGARRDEISDDDWPTLNNELMGWGSGMYRTVLDASLNYADGTCRSGLIGGSGRYFEDDTAIEAAWWGSRSPVDMDALESITVAGSTYRIK